MNQTKAYKNRTTTRVTFELAFNLMGTVQLFYRSVIVEPIAFQAIRTTGLTNFDKNDCEITAVIYKHLDFKHIREQL